MKWTIVNCNQKSEIRTTTKRNRWSYDVRNLAWQCARTYESRGERGAKSRAHSTQKSKCQNICSEHSTWYTNIFPKFMHVISTAFILLLAMSLKIILQHGAINIKPLRGLQLQRPSIGVFTRKMFLHQHQLERILSWQIDTICWGPQSLQSLIRLN